MTLSDVIERVDAIKPNAFEKETKTMWVNECEGVVQTEVLLLATEQTIVYSYAEHKDCELLVHPPHDKLYVSYLMAMIDFANGEYNKYQNTMQLFNSHLGEYMRWFARTYRPADGNGSPWRGYYITAYGIAVKNGFVGTEEEWLESLTGAPGREVEMRYDTDTEYVQYRLAGDEVWNSLISMSDIQGEVVSKTLASLESAQQAATAAASEAQQAAAVVDQSMTKAQESAESAQRSASVAEEKATVAEANATLAQKAADDAATSAENLASAETAATKAAADAGLYATKAEGSATDAEGYAEQAQTAAEEAKQAASTSSGYIVSDSEPDVSGNIGKFWVNTSVGGALFYNNGTEWTPTSAVWS